LGITSYSKYTNHSVLKNFKHFDKIGEVFLDTISVGTRTGRPSNKVDLENVDSDERFSTRSEALNLLSNYRVNYNASYHCDEPKQLISPLLILFEYQEEHVFDIPQKTTPTASDNVRLRRIHDNSKSIDIEVSDLDSGKHIDKKPRKDNPSKSSGNSISYAADYELIKGLDSILSGFESQDANGSINNLSSNGYYNDDVKSQVHLSPEKSQFHKRTNTMSKVSAKAVNSSRVLVDDSNYLMTIKKVPGRRKTRPLSSRHGKLSLFDIVKNLDEISSEMESSITN
jgi:hypothetical protein